MAGQLLMGNEAIGLGAIHAGVNLVTGYPGTPSTEILETVAKNNTEGRIHVEWSVNEKAALEVAAGAAYTGARTLVTMKQVGLNVASDPLMSLAYVGVKGGMVIVSADDPGPISSQTEQDTRHFGVFSKLPVFDPTSPEEAYEMVQDAFAYSEKYATPVLLRPTTRVCHGCAAVEVKEVSGEGASLGNQAYWAQSDKPKEFVKDPGRWVIFPRLSYQNHKKIEERNEELSHVFSSYRFNTVEGGAGLRKGVAAGGISYAYVKESISKNVPLLRVGTPHPFPEELARKFLEGLDEVLVFEELDPVIERSLLQIAGKYHLSVTIRGKLTHDTANAGENSVESVREDLMRFADETLKEEMCKEEELLDGAFSLKLPPLPVRPPVLCAGCPHRASFYAVKQAAKGRKAVFSGDIGCYTLGNAKPLDMVDTCLCMGADVTMAQGLHIIERDAVNFAFIGDSTFFASGITGVINGVYNQTDIILVVLDNSTTAMTGHQPHPGTGRTMMGEVVTKVSIEKVLEGIGVNKIVKADPLRLEEAIAAVRQVLDEPGVRAVIFKSPCIAVTKAETCYRVNETACVSCRQCIRELGCPAIVACDGKVSIEAGLCYGCGVCAKICKFGAIQEVDHE
ncbi:hypothetical protein IMSAGC018_01362 [Lachnospiraceae bacterium]|nr:hypothetical protein IMSAGC018_01362 [Lachnospiraceae bacterium]